MSNESRKSDFEQLTDQRPKDLAACSRGVTHRTRRDPRIAYDQSTHSCGQSARAEIGGLGTVVPGVFRFPRERSPFRPRGNPERNGSAYGFSIAHDVEAAKQRRLWNREAQLSGNEA